MSPTIAPHCPFCNPDQDYREIIAGAYMRIIYPKNPSCMYHTLILPRRHIERFDELSSDEVVELHKLVQKLHSVLTKKLGKQYIGYNLLANNGGSQVNQHVMHSHMHMYNRTIHDSVDPVKSHKKDKTYSLTDIEKGYMQQLQQWAEG